ncbi:MAG: hypothetical protein ACI9LE_002191 [Paraglaciecola sp.]|jgi:hypothetical protein
MARPTKALTNTEVDKAKPRDKEYNFAISQTDRKPGYLIISNRY